jgi:hypothetical protein
MRGVHVDTRVRLPPRGGRKGRGREIDVLVSGQFAGLPTCVAIECKNERERIGVEYIDAFVGKLDHVGIPCSFGIYVSASGYTIDAIERAAEAGIHTFVLEGVQGGISNHLLSASTLTVYLMPVVGELTIENTVAATQVSQQMLLLWGDDGKVKGNVLDLVWNQWISGEIPSTLGDHHLVVPVPPEYRFIVDGLIVPVTSVTAKVHVIGNVVVARGEARRHRLVRAQTGEVERENISASFDPTVREFPVHNVRSDEELSELISGLGGVNLSLGRFRLPRILFGSFCWPFSERAFLRVRAIMQAFADGLIPDPRPLRLQDVEGTDLSAAFESPSPRHPAIRQALLEWRQREAERVWSVSTLI